MDPHLQLFGAVLYSEDHMGFRFEYLTYHLTNMGQNHHWVDILHWKEKVQGEIK